MSLPVPEVCKDEEGLEKPGSSPKGETVLQQEQRKRQSRKTVYVQFQGTSKLGAESQALGPWGDI